MWASRRTWADRVTSSKLGFAMFDHGGIGFCWAGGSFHKDPFDPFVVFVQLVSVWQVIMHALWSGMLWNFPQHSRLEMPLFQQEIHHNASTFWIYLSIEYIQYEDTSPYAMLDYHAGYGNLQWGRGSPTTWAWDELWDACAEKGNVFCNSCTH